MPATSPAQQRLFALALHSPGKLRRKNKGLTKLPTKTLHDFAATKYSAMKPPKPSGSMSEMMKY